MHTLWDHQYTSRPPLHGEEHADVLILGGGITGLAAAYFLNEAGCSVVLIEKETIGSGSTGHSAGMLVCELETAPWRVLLQRIGLQKTKTFWDAQVKALHLVERIVEEAHIACDLEKDMLLEMGHDAAARRFIAKDFAARRRLHIPAIFLDDDSLFQELHAHTSTVGEKIGQALSVNPLVFARGFAHHLKERGVRIYEHTPGSVNQHVCKTPHGSITFEHAVLARGTSERGQDVDVYLTTIAITQPLLQSELENLGLEDKDMFLDDGKRSFHYGKITRDGRLLVGYGDVLMRGEIPQKPHAPHVRSIERYLKRTFPDIHFTFEYVWSAPYALAKGLLPVVRKTEEGIVVNGAGTQLASIAAASYAASLITGAHHPLASLFDAHTH